jgi:hypothetical protein
MLLDTGKGLLRAAPQYLSGDTMGAAKSLFGAAMSSFKESKADDALRAQNTSPADVILFSGCKDDQTVSRECSGCSFATSGSREIHAILTLSPPTPPRKARPPAPCPT